MPQNAAERGSPPHGSRVEELEGLFREPPAEYGFVTTWFWNDDIEEDELLRQLRLFHSAGFGGVMIHARVGLSRRIGYLTPEWFRLVRLAVVEAARLGLKVMLYDEGSYPSGSAQGKVVAESPEHASRCLIPVTRQITGPARGYWRPDPGRALRDELLCAVAAREGADGALDPSTLEPLPLLPNGLVAYDLPAGAWRIVSVWAAFSGATIRGVFEEEEDDHALAPAAADIMSPGAVDCFIRHTHELYAEAVGDYFGSTVVALFTDEPNALGRSPRRGPGPAPYTPGLLDEIRRSWSEAGAPGDPTTWLPALWYDLGDTGELLRRLYGWAVEHRIRRVFYGAQRRWCAAHGLALTGHPAASDDLASLSCFDWPGQDMVWRYVEPATAGALEGRHSVAAKVAGSAAALERKPRAAAEIFGAYGWRLSADEMKWLLDWHLVRGVSCIIPHASFYSIRGRRAFESQPDLGFHSSLWPAIRALAVYARRVCALLAGGRELCDVAVLTDPGHAAWRAAAELYQGQIDFLYLDAAAIGRGKVEGGALLVGSHAFRAVVYDGLPVNPPQELGAARALLRALSAAGGLVLQGWAPGSLAALLRAHHEPDLLWSGGPDLRCLHVERRGAGVYLLSNEGERRIEGELRFRRARRLEWWDAWRGRIRGEAPAVIALERRESALLVELPAEAPERAPRAPRLEPGPAIALPQVAWRAIEVAGAPASPPPLADWGHREGWETFSGTALYSGELTLDAAQASEAAFVDLGDVGEIAEVSVNGRELGLAAWAPYLLPLEGSLRPGRNQILVRVSNSMANAYDGLQLRSGLIGPVVLRGRRGS